MTTQELEELLEGGAETQRIEFKNPCLWDVEIFAKDILALSNVQDGGYIIIGVEETKSGTFQRKGITDGQRESFKTDIMRDQMAAFADPHTNFNVEFPKDKNGIEYAVIRVFPFEEIPVICNKDSRDTKKAIIYYRNKNRRVESAPVSNSYDMRDIIKLATIRMMQRKIELGFTVEPSVKKKLDEELEGL
jgi:predicted HTH transcriptional regulator